MRYFLLIILYTATAGTAYALGPGNETAFQPLVGIPFLQKSGNTLSTEDYVQALYVLAISAASLLMILRMMQAGVKIIFSEGVTARESAKKDIQGMLLGFLIILGAVTILETINPQLTNLDALRNAQSFNDSIQNTVPGNGNAPDIVNDDGEINTGSSHHNSTAPQDDIDAQVRKCEAKGCRANNTALMNGSVVIDCFCTSD